MFASSSYILDEDGTQSETLSKRLRRYCFTINNPTDKNMLRMMELYVTCKEMTYLCFSIEHAETTMTEHIQGYCEFEKAGTVQGP